MLHPPIPTMTVTNFCIRLIFSSLALSRVLTAVHIGGIRASALFDFLNAFSVTATAETTSKTSGAFTSHSDNNLAHLKETSSLYDFEPTRNTDEFSFILHSLLLCSCMSFRYNSLSAFFSGGMLIICWAISPGRTVVWNTSAIFSISLTFKGTLWSAFTCVERQII